MINPPQLSFYSRRVGPYSPPGLLQSCVRCTRRPRHGILIILFIAFPVHPIQKSHTSIVDKNGMAVAITSTVNLVFGSQVIDPETGILLNDEMDDFSTPGTPNSFELWPSPCQFRPSPCLNLIHHTHPSDAVNYPQPGKRPLSSTAPTIAENPDGSLFIAIGGSGGSRIFPSVFQVLLNLDWGLDIRDAIEFSRLHDQLFPLTTDVDGVYPKHILDDLRQRGHNVSGTALVSITSGCVLIFFSAAVDANKVGAIQGVMQTDSSIYGGS